MIIKPKKMIKILTENNKKPFLDYIKNKAISASTDVSLLSLTAATKSNLYVMLDKDMLSISIFFENSDIAKNDDNMYYTDFYKFIREISN